MKKANFHTLQNLPVPESWIENALAIPEKAEQAPAVIPFRRRPRVIAAAAGIVLVSILSVILYFAVGSNPPVSVKPSSVGNSLPTEVIWSTDAYGETVATEYVVVPDGSAPQNGTSPAAGTIGRAADPTDSPNTAAAPATTASGSPSSTEKPSATESSASTSQPNDNGDDPVPTEAKPDSVTEPDLPYEPTPLTEAPCFPDNPTNPPRPTDPPHPTDPPPTEDPDPDAKYYRNTIETIVNVGEIPQGSPLYLKLIDGHGNLLGDPDLFSDQHRVNVVWWQGSSVKISYTPKDYGIIPKRGYYRYKIYDQNGKSLKGYSRAGLNP